MIFYSSMVTFPSPLLSNSQLSASQLYLAGNSLGPAGACALFSGFSSNMGLRCLYLVSERWDLAMPTQG